MLSVICSYSFTYQKYSCYFLLISCNYLNYRILQQQVRFLDMWEPAVLAIKREGYSIKCNGQRGVVITEKFQEATAVCPYALEYVISGNGMLHLLVFCVCNYNLLYFNQCGLTLFFRRKVSTILFCI
jgi:hypothetical protein